jgi:RecA-family ATPase
MARFINKLDQIRLKYKCTIVLVHHTGKSENQGARGASALKAYVATCSEAINEESKASQFRRSKKNLITTGRVTEHEDRSLTIAQAA